jgi:hypothetical protein
MLFDTHLHRLIPSAWLACWIFFVASLCYLSVLELMADCVGLWFWNLLLLYYRLALHPRHRTLEPGLAGTGTGNLWTCNVSRGDIFWYGFSGISGIFYGKWEFFFLSLLCVIVIVVVDQCRLCCGWFIL